MTAATWTTFAVVVAAFLLSSIALGDGRVSPASTATVVLLALVMTRSGAWLLRVGGLSTLQARLPAALIVGLVALAVPMTGWVLFSNLSVLGALCATGLTMMALGYGGSRRVPHAPPPDRADLLFAALACISILVFARVAITLPHSLAQNGVLSIWSDYLLHGVSIASFGSPFSGNTDLEFVGERRPFYHYAPFLLPGVLQVVTGMSGFAAATSILLPLGLMVAAFGVYVLAVEWGGRAGGLLATVLALCVPLYLFPLQSGLFDFHWLLFIAPGTGFGIGVASLVCASLLRWLNEGDRRQLLITIILLCSLVLIRAHMFLLLTPVVCGVWFLHRWWHWRAAIARPVAGALAICFVVSVVVSWHRAAAGEGLQAYLDLVLKSSLLFGHALDLADYALLPRMAVATVVALMAILGPLTFLYPMLFWQRLRRRALRPDDLLVPLAVFTFVGLMLLAPTAANEDTSEYRHRHFPLLYVLVAVRTITYVIDPERATRRLGHQAGWIIQASSIALLAAALILSRNVNPARPNIVSMPWARNYHDQPIAPGILDVAGYLRAHARRGDVLAMSSSARDTDPRALLIEAIAFSGLPALLARAPQKERRSACLRESTRARLAILDRIATSGTGTEAMNLLRDNGVRWYLTSPAEPPAWDRTGAGAAYSSHGILVYDAGAAAQGSYGKPAC